MVEPQSVTIAELRTGIDRALRLAQDLLGEEVALPVGHYWHLPVEAAFDLTDEPSGHTVGQVSDDLAAVRDGHSGVPQEAPHELAHLIGVLRALELAAKS